MKISSKDLVLYAISISLTTLLTFLFSFPALVYNGYVNLGDVSVILSGFMFGPLAGFVVGGLGSAIADLLLGYAVYAPISFIVKGFEALVAAYLLKTTFHDKPIFAAIFAGLTMVLGYFLAEGIFLYGLTPALASVPGNLLQAAVGIILSSIIFQALKKREIHKYDDEEKN